MSYILDGCTAPLNSAELPIICAGSLVMQVSTAVNKGKHPWLSLGRENAREIGEGGSSCVTGNGSYVRGIHLLVCD